ncbi:MAG: hypothetical protein KGI29_09670 [Pseudomonadota bacterium]|nr:hypothetical protein [Pseudomonadota bacterium]MDE3038024.1 hypothetical protein [Pseudomonadota bacterium]
MTSIITEDQFMLDQENGHRFDIGYITPEEKHTLNKAMKEGRVLKVKAYWPWLLAGTCVKMCYINTEHMANGQVRG